jgi:hypothetical protein
MDIPARKDGGLILGQDVPMYLPKDGDGKIVAKKQWTEREIQALSADQYQLLLGDKNFVRAVDALGEPPAES